MLIYNGSRIRLPTVTGFQSQQQTHRLTSMPLNDMPAFYDTPTGGAVGSISSVTIRAQTTCSQRSRADSGKPGP
ncbi:hypothetical protein RAA17_12240 [Komagataeibacter rhaeticus]|nr:hypothetical protein [Komagataeibacter rhaeticus]